MEPIILPDLNNRIKDVINFFNDGNIAAFSRTIDNVAQQRIDRLFKIDRRTGKIPSVPNELIKEIICKYKNVDPVWLQTGKGEMLIKDIQRQELISSENEIPKSGDDMLSALLKLINSNGLLVESNNILVKAQDKLAEAHKILAETNAELIIQLKSAKSLQTPAFEPTVEGK